MLKTGAATITRPYETKRVRHRPTARINHKRRNTFTLPRTGRERVRLPDPFWDKMEATEIHPRSKAREPDDHRNAHAFPRDPARHVCRRARHALRSCERGARGVSPHGSL